MSREQELKKLIDVWVCRANNTTKIMEWVEAINKVEELEKEMLKLNPKYISVIEE